MNNDKALEIAYKEIVDARKQQQEDLALIYSKFNWITVSGIVLIGLMINLKEQNFFSYLSLVAFVVSLIFSLLGLRMKPSKRGPILSDMLSASDKIEFRYFLKALNKKITGDIEKNKKIIRKFGKDLEVSVELLLLGIISIACYFLSPFFINFLKTILCKC